ncbi:tRNA 5-methoxyuridine(34)/uridine 5-oxyacetic acid(34) synthase CmoB [Helicobacter sp. 12S02634-8]|nr:tRNA 5-methoxyuridine(34)/uridine 5-oxyacetic acid(34) synthase CmoB [Helicobacter sp. 12S02634-8]
MPYSYAKGIIIALPPFLDTELYPLIQEIALDLKPWRKGPFYLGELFIDTEWQSFMKWDRIACFVDLAGKDVADIGCNNGFYLFAMAKSSPKSLTGFDPSGLYKMQFDFINLFIQQTITYELLGVEHLKIYDKKFDMIFCLGVLYHRSDPILTLKALYAGLKEEGEVILDTLVIDSSLEIALCPKTSYAKMPNVYFIPSVPTLEGWCIRAGFSCVEVLAIWDTTPQEQRKTQWIDGQSLESFLDPKDMHRTIEGYDAPKRGYFRLKRTKNGRTKTRSI